jgi:hypothetical protein
LVAGLEQQKGVLEKRIEQLRTFEREYRIRLKSYLETQLRDLDSRASAEPAQGPQGGPPAQTGAPTPAYSSAYSRAGAEGPR